MKLPRRKQPKPLYAEISSYVNDLETLSIMRDKADKNGYKRESEQHSTTIAVMQSVLEYLLELSKRKLYYSYMTNRERTLQDIIDVMQTTSTKKLKQIIVSDDLIDTIISLQHDRIRNDPNRVYKGENNGKSKSTDLAAT